MSSKRIISQTARLFLPSTRVFSTSTWQFDERTLEQHRKHQIDRPLNPHMTNTTSTITNEMPSLGKDKPPPEMISSVDGDYVPKDSVPENAQHMTGGTQMPVAASDSGPDKEFEVGEMEGASFKVEPKRRFGEDMNTLRARLQCMSSVSFQFRLYRTCANEAEFNRSKQEKRNPRVRPTPFYLRRRKSFHHDQGTTYAIRSLPRRERLGHLLLGDAGTNSNVHEIY